MALAAQREAKAKPRGPCTQKARAACTFIFGGEGAGGGAVSTFTAAALPLTRASPTSPVTFAARRPIDVSGDSRALYRPRTCRAMR